MAMGMFLPNGSALRIIMRVVFTIICVIVYLSSRCKGACAYFSAVSARICDLGFGRHLRSSQFKSVLFDNVGTQKFLISWWTFIPCDSIL